VFGMVGSEVHDSPRCITSILNLDKDKNFLIKIINMKICILYMFNV
jgi:hypothetical protein